MSHPLMPHQIDANEIKQVDDQQTAAQTDKQLLAAPTSRDMNGTSATDVNAEYIVVGLEFSAVAAGTLYLENADGGGSARKSITYQFPATFNSGLIPTWIQMGKGLPLKYTSTGTNPNVSLKVHYILKKYGLQR